MLSSLSYDSSEAGAGLAAFIVVLVLVEVVLVGFGIWLYWRLAAKTGWPGWYALGMLVPVLNLVLILMAAFKEWPIEAENRMLRHQLAYGGHGDSSGYGGYDTSGIAPGYPPAAPPGYQAPDRWTHPSG